MNDQMMKIVEQKQLNQKYSRKKYGKQLLVTSNMIVEICPSRKQEPERVYCDAGWRDSKIILWQQCINRL